MKLAERLAALMSCTSAEDVAALLRRSGAVGERGVSTACPAARFLAGAPDCAQACVAPGKTVRTWAEWSSDAPTMPRDYDMPPHVGEFTRRFDQGREWPDLETSS